MKLFESRNSVLAQAFELPLFGQAAKETPPKWIIDRIKSGEFEMNDLGGITMNTPFGCQSCIAGDIVVLVEDDSIVFCDPAQFSSEWTPLQSDHLQAA